MQISVNHHRTKVLLVCCFSALDIFFIELVVDNFDDGPGFKGKSTED